MAVYENGDISGPETLAVTVRQSDDRTFCVKAGTLRIVTKHVDSYPWSALTGSMYGHTVRDTRGLCNFQTAINIPIWEFVVDDGSLIPSLDERARNRTDTYQKLAYYCSQKRLRGDTAPLRSDYHITVYSENLNGPTTSDFSPKPSNFTINYQCFPRTAPVAFQSLVVAATGKYDLDRGVKSADNHDYTGDIYFVEDKNGVRLVALAPSAIAIANSADACFTAQNLSSSASYGAKSITSGSYLCTNTSQNHRLTFSIDSGYDSGTKSFRVKPVLRRVQVPVARPAIKQVPR